MSKVVKLVIISKEYCPYRQLPDPEDGWGPQIPTCRHPLRKLRGHEGWCSNGKENNPFPPTCPISNGETFNPASRKCV